MRVNLSGRGTPDREGALPVRRSCREGCDSASELAKSDPRAPRRRSRSQRCIFTLDWVRLWASETVRTSLRLTRLGSCRYLWDRTHKKRNPLLLKQKRVLSSVGGTLSSAFD